LSAQVIRHPDEELFWGMVWTLLNEAEPELFPVKFNSAQGFAEAFSRKSDDGRKIIIIWDEFDRYTFGNDSRWATLLSTIRELKQNVLTGTSQLLEVLVLAELMCCLINNRFQKGIIIVGAYRAGKIPPDFQDSPFNAAVDLQPLDLYFTYDETKLLFQMAEQEFQIQIEENTLSYIHKITAGLVRLDTMIQTYLIAIQIVGTQAWLTYVVGTSSITCFQQETGRSQSSKNELC